MQPAGQSSIYTTQFNDFKMLLRYVDDKKYKNIIGGLRP